MTMLLLIVGIVPPARWHHPHINHPNLSYLAGWGDINALIARPNNFQWV